MARAGMTSQGGPRNPNRVTSRPASVPASGSGRAPNNPRQPPLMGPAPDGAPGRPPSAPLLPLPGAALPAGDPENGRR